MPSMAPEPEVKVKTPEVKVVPPEPGVPVTLPSGMKESPKLWKQVEAPKPKRRVKTRRPGKNLLGVGNGEAFQAPPPPPPLSLLEAPRPFLGLGMGKRTGKALVPGK